MRVGQRQADVRANSVGSRPMLLPASLEHSVERFHIARCLHVRAEMAALQTLINGPEKRERRELSHTGARRRGSNRGGLFPVSAAYGRQPVPRASSSRFVRSVSRSILAKRCGLDA